MMEVFRMIKNLDGNGPGPNNGSTYSSYNKKQNTSNKFRP